MRFLHSLIYGFVSGLAEFLPVSNQIHQALMMEMFGMSQREPIRDLLVHIALILALWTSANSLVSRVRRDHSLSGEADKKNLNRPAARSAFDMRLVRTAATPMLLMLLFYLLASRWEHKPVILALVSILNGILLIIPEYMRHGNKDARKITSSESIMIGIFSGLSAVPGISRTGMCIASSTACGADSQNSSNWALLLSLPALALFIVFDFINLFVIGVSGVTFLAILGYLVSAIFAFIGGYISVMILRLISERTGLYAFAFYSWGMALFTFFLYLIT